MQAPVPFLVGIHSRYLLETSSDRRPEGVVFIDLDNDSIYLGLDEDMWVRSNDVLLIAAFRFFILNFTEYVSFPTS